MARGAAARSTNLIARASGPALGAAPSRPEEIWAAQRFAPGAEALLALPEAAP